MEAIAYCSKDESRLEGPWIFGKPSPGQGHRSDLESVGRRIVEGASLRDIAEESPGCFARYWKGFIALQEFTYKPAWREIRCFYILGPPGSGKSSLIYELFGYSEVYSVASKKHGWFDGYLGQRVLLVDEYAGTPEPETLNELLDGHPFRLAFKGGFYSARYTIGVVVANEPYCAGWPDSTLRRFESGGFYRLDGRHTHGQPNDRRDRLGRFILGTGPKPLELEFQPRQSVLRHDGPRSLFGLRV